MHQVKLNYLKELELLICPKQEKIKHEPIYLNLNIYIKINRLHVDITSKRRELHVDVNATTITHMQSEKKESIIGQRMS